MNSEVAQILEHKRQIMQGKGDQPKKYACIAISFFRRPLLQSGSHEFSRAWRLARAQ